MEYIWLVISHNFLRISKCAMEGHLKIHNSNIPQSTLRQTSSEFISLASFWTKFIGVQAMTQDMAASPRYSPCCSHGLRLHHLLLPPSPSTYCPVISSPLHHLPCTLFPPAPYIPPSWIAIYQSLNCSTHSRFSYQIGRTFIFRQVFTGLIQ